MWRYAAAQCNGFINDKTMIPKVPLFFSCPYRNGEIVNKKHEVGKVYKSLPENNGTYLIIRKSL